MSFLLSYMRWKLSRALMLHSWYVTLNLKQMVGCDPDLEIIHLHLTGLSH